MLGYDSFNNSFSDAHIHGPFVAKAPETSKISVGKDARKTREIKKERPAKSEHGR